MERNLSTSRAAERELVLAFQSGDQAAFETIVRTCRPAAERICRRLLMNPADAEEAVQETMVRAYQGLPRFNGSYALTAWIARIATNVSLDALRASARRPQNGGTIEPDTEALAAGESGPRSPEDLLELADQAREVRDVLASLPEQHRTALVLREFEGYSHRQIASMLDTSPARVKALIHRAKAGFRRAWGNEHHPERLAAFAPLLTPINWFRRLLGRAPEFDSTTSAASAASAASVASAPAAQTLVTIASERASVLATVMLAGTMGFAVQNAPAHSRAEEREPVAVEVVEAPIDAREANPARKTEEEQEEKKPGPEPTVTPTPTVTPSVAAEVEVKEAEPVATPPPKEGTAQPAGGATPAAPPSPPPHTASFTASGQSSEDQCGCPAIALKEGSLEGELGGEVSFSQTLSGALRDKEGDAAWQADVSISGRAGGDAPAFALTFRVFTPRGSYTYSGEAAFGGALQKDGVWTYGFEGAYSVQSGPGGFDQMPRSGTLRVELAWHQNGSPVRTSLTLA